MNTGEPTGDLGRRALTSASWNLLSALARMSILLVRSILLARWLPVATFGVYGLTMSLVAFAGILASFGLFQAFLHRCPATENEEEAAAVHFTLSTLFTVAWAAVLAVSTLLLAGGEHRFALLVLIPTVMVERLTATPRAILIRRVLHARLAVLQLAHAAVGTVIAGALAWQGETLWALLSVDISLAVLSVLFLWVWRPVWRPRLRWASQQVRYFLSFGAANLLADFLAACVGRLDRLWTGFILGDVQLGLYSRAMAFASYPQRILSQPIDLVAGGSFAELKGDHQRLSEAFFRTIALLVRAGFVLAGLLALTAPQLIALLIGDRWLPMVPIFRLMLLYALLDPIKLTTAQLFVAVGRPDSLVRAHLAQVLVLLTGLLTLGTTIGVRGVALTVDAMLMVGIAVLMVESRRHGRFSPARLFVAPVAALAVGLLVALASGTMLGDSLPALARATARAASFVGSYSLVLATLEGRSLLRMASLALAGLRGRGSHHQPPSGPEELSRREPSGISEDDS